jgi:hypothetical protein
MTDREIQQFLKDNGYPDYVVKAGRKGLLERWRKFVEQVEKGYRFGLYDYRNDLDTRALLARLGLDSEAAEWDERLKAMLTSTRTRVWESDPPEAFWNFGHPKNASGELREDLEAEGLWKAPRKRAEGKPPRKR